jgi:hypothetical protein
MCLSQTLNFDDALAAYADALALVGADDDPRPRHAIAMALKRCQAARDKVAVNGKAAGMGALEALMSEEALREIMQGDDSFEGLFGGKPRGGGGLGGGGGGGLATLGEGDEGDEDGDGGESGGSQGRLRWGNNEVMRSEDVDARVLREVGPRGDDGGGDDGEGGSQKPSCRGGHGLKPYTAPTDALKCDRCRQKMAKDADFYGCKPCVATVCLACYTAGGGEVER